MLLELFILSFIFGYITIWLSVPSSTDTVIIFESEEELHKICWEGLRKGKQ